jgi:hypothetical protein
MLLGRPIGNPTANGRITEDGVPGIMIAASHYLDAFAKMDASSTFAERKLLFDWSETRPSSAGT